MRYWGNLQDSPDLTFHGYAKSSSEKFAKKIGAGFVPDCAPEKKKEPDEKYRKMFEKKSLDKEKTTSTFRFMVQIVRDNEYEKRGHPKYLQEEKEK